MPDQAPTSSKQLVKLLCGIALILLGRFFLNDSMGNANKLLAQSGDSFLWVMRLGQPPLLTGNVFGTVLILTGTFILALSIRRIVYVPIVKSQVILEGHFRITPLIWILFVSAMIALITFSNKVLGDLLSNEWVVLWIIGLVLLGIIVYMLDRSRNTTLGTIWDSWQEIAWVGLISTVCFIYIMHDTCHWRWAGTPDEAHFFHLADLLARNETHRFLLSENGVFGYHPVLSTCFQAIFMKWFGSTCFAWKMASALSLAGALPGIYLAVKRTLDIRSAYASMLLMSFAQLSVGFAHFGYNNIQVFLPVCWSLGIMIIAIQRSSLLGYYLAGIIAGLGFYTYYPARISILLVLFMYLVYARPMWRHAAWSNLISLSVGFLVTLIPVWMRMDEVMAHMLQQTAVSGGRAVQTGQAWDWIVRFVSSDKILDILLQWYLAVTHGVWFINPHHFQTNPIMDPISGSFAMVGVWLIVFRAKRFPSAFFWLGAYGIATFITGAISQYERPPLTRLMLLVPFSATLAIIAYRSFEEEWMSRLDARRLIRSAGWIVMSAVVIWNVIALRISIYREHHGYGDGTTSELLIASRTLPPDFQIVMIQRKSTYMECVDMVFDIFDDRNRIHYLKPFDERVESTIAALEPPFALFYDLRDNADIKKLKEWMAARFPDLNWRRTDQGKSWDLTYCIVPDIDL